MVENYTRDLDIYTSCAAIFKTNLALKLNS